MQIKDIQVGALVGYSVRLHGIQVTRVVGRILEINDDVLSIAVNPSANFPEKNINGVVHKISKSEFESEYVIIEMPGEVSDGIL